MNEPISSAAGYALVKLYGIKAIVGMLGTSLLYLALPPMNSDGSLNKHEFLFRLFCAGVFSAVFGDAAVDLLCRQFPALGIEHSRAAVYLLVGAPAWMITRAVALWVQARKGKDIAEIAKEVKDAL